MHSITRNSYFKSMKNLQLRHYDLDIQKSIYKVGFLSIVCKINVASSIILNYLVGGSNTRILETCSLTYISIVKKPNPFYNQIFIVLKWSLNTFSSLVSKGAISTMCFIWARPRSQI